MYSLMLLLLSSQKIMYIWNFKLPLFIGNGRMVFIRPFSIFLDIYFIFLHSLSNQSLPVLQLHLVQCLVFTGWSRLSVWCVWCVSSCSSEWWLPNANTSVKHRDLWSRKTKEDSRRMDLISICATLPVSFEHRVENYPLKPETPLNRIY